MMIKVLRKSGGDDYRDLVDQLEEDLKEDCSFLDTWKKAKAYLEAGTVEMNDHRFIVDLKVRGSAFATLSCTG